MRQPRRQGEARTAGTQRLPCARSHWASAPSDCSFEGGVGQRSNWGHSGVHTLDTRLDTTTEFVQIISSSRGAGLRCAARSRVKKSALESQATRAELFSWMPEEGLEPPTFGL
jgi:hypothetical protein